VTVPTDIRIAPWASGSASDIAAIGRLIDALGYPLDGNPVADRLSRMQAMSMAIPSSLLLARLPGTDEIVGFLHIVVPALIEIDPSAEIWGLVVSEGHRGRRIGQRLVEAAEAWARERDVTAIRLRTNELRTEAHRFYERLGFEHVKTSRTYVKSL
jgi:ribosomal protein S18 acetylase RimI-like enzyme